MQFHSTTGQLMYTAIFTYFQRTAVEQTS